MARVRISTTVDDQLIERARALWRGRTDASLVEAALEALLREHCGAEIDRAYEEAFDRVPVDTQDEWGDLGRFLDGAARS